MSSLDVLRELFALACSQQPQVARAADVDLSRLSSERGFYPAVAKLVADVGADPGVRLQAVLFLKNAIETIWLKNRVDGQDSSMLLDEEKSAIRATLLSAYNDASKQISLHIAIVISKIARFDCPQNWPELLPHLASAIDNSMASADRAAHEQALFVLYSIVKTLAARRLPAGKRIFHMLCCEVFDPVYRYWKVHLSQAEIDAASSQSAVLCLKALRYMVLYGFSDPSSSPSASDFLTSLAAFVQNVVQLAASASDERREALHKIILVSLKLIVEFHEHSPLECVPWLAPYLELASQCAFGVYTLPTLAHVRAINIMKLVLLCQDYRGSTKSAGDASTQAANLSAVFFSAERVCGFCQVLIERYLILTPDEMDSWRNEPEVYATQEDSEAWRNMLRPAAESFFVALVHECWEQAAPLAAQWLQVVGKPLLVYNAQDVLARDAILAAIGLASNDLYQEVDFDAVFTNVCLPLMTTPPDSDAQRILLRRIIWLCGKWIDVKFSKELRPQLYDQLIRIIGTVNYDMVIRLTACDVLKRAVDEYEFELESFNPYLNNAVSALISLLQSCRESDSQMRVVTTLWLLAERAGRSLVGNVDAIVAYVPSLWQSENCMLKGQILNLFTQLVKALGSECHVLMDGLCAMLGTALNADDPAHVYLLEEGLDLWLALVENSQAPIAPQLISLFRFMPQLLTIQSENLRICCDIVKAYCLYGDTGFANTYLPELGGVYRSILAEMRSEGITSVLKVVEMIIRCFTKDALGPMSGVIGWCIETLTASQEAMSVMVMCIAIVALVSMHNVQQLYSVMASAMNEEVISNFLKKWLELIGLMSHDMERRKCNGLGLCAWMTLPIRPVEVIFPDIVSTLVDVLFDICIEENGAYVDSLVTYDFGVCGGDDTAGFLQTEHDKRSQRLRDMDSVYSTPLQTQVMAAVETRKRMTGAEAFETIWKRVDDEVVRSLRKLCPM